LLINREFATKKLEQSGINLQKSFEDLYPAAGPPYINNCSREGLWRKNVLQTNDHTLCWQKTKTGK
jgi:hypothetical protein